MTPRWRRPHDAIRLRPAPAPSGITRLAAPRLRSRPSGQAGGSLGTRTSFRARLRQGLPTGWTGWGAFLGLQQTPTPRMSPDPARRGSRTREQIRYSTFLETARPYSSRPSYRQNPPLGDIKPGDLPSSQTVLYSMSTTAGAAHPSRVTCRRLIPTCGGHSGAGGGPKGGLRTLGPRSSPGESKMSVHLFLHRQATSGTVHGRRR